MSDIIGGGAILGTSALLYSQTLGTGFAGTEVARNPIWYPRLLLLMLAAAGALLVVRGLVLGPDRAAQPRWSRFGLAVVAVGAYFLFFDRVGFLVASIIFIPLLTFLLGYRRVLVTAMVSVIFVALIWYCFVQIFMIRPPGVGLDDLAGWL